MWAAGRRREKKKKKQNDTEESLYLTGDMILFGVIDLLSHLFPHFFSFAEQGRQLLW